MIDQFNGKRILITGGTGFVGCALIGRLMDSSAEIGITTRNIDRFSHRAPALAKRTLYFEGIALDLLIGMKADYIIHLEDTGTESLDHILKLAGECGARVLFASSGAVYGRHAPLYASEIDKANPNTAYAMGKATLEQHAIYYSMPRWEGAQISCVIARMFAFVGPYLPLDANYAIGNFIGDGLHGGPILVRGTGAAVRSYLYTTDLADWLLGLLLNGKSGEAYNVGSEDALTIAELAKRVATHFPHNPEVIIKGDPSQASNVYVPDTSKAWALKLRQTVSLDDAIDRTIEWNRKQLPLRP